MHGARLPKLHAIPRSHLFWYNIWFSVSDADHATIIRISAPQTLNSAPEGASSRSRSPSRSPEGEAAPQHPPDPPAPRPAALRLVPPLPVYHKYQVLAPGGYRTQFLSQSSLLAIKIMAAGRHGFHKRCFHGSNADGRGMGRGSDSVYYALRYTRLNARPLTPRESDESMNMHADMPTAPPRTGCCGSIYL